MADWKVLSLPVDGPIELFPDGRYSFGFGTFDQGSSLQNVTVNDAHLTKEAGVGKVLRVKAADQTHLFKYENGLWHYKIGGGGGCAGAALLFVSCTAALAALAMLVN